MSPTNFELNMFMHELVQVSTYVTSKLGTLLYRYGMVIFILPDLPGAKVVKGVNYTIRELFLLLPSWFEELVTETDEKGIFAPKMSFACAMYGMPAGWVQSTSL